MKTKTKDFVILRSRKRASGLEALYLDMSYDGERKTEYLKLYLTGGKSREDKAKDKETMRQAEVIRAQRVLEMQNRRMGLPKLNPENVLFYPYFDRIMDKKTAGNRNIWYHAKVVLMQYHPDQNLRFSEITPRWVRGFCEYLDEFVPHCLRPNYKVNLDRRLREATKILYFTKFKELLEHAVRDEIILRNPAKGMGHFRYDGRRKEFLTVEELKRLSGTPVKNKMIKEMFLFSCLTGLRWSDVVGLRWDNVHRDSGRTWISFNQQKTKIEVTIDLDAQAISLMGDPGQEDEKVFQIENCRTSVQYNLDKWMKAAGINKHITFHCARHTFATLMLSRGVDIYTVSRLLGHTSIETTQIYLRLIDDNRIKAMQKVPKIMDI